jgi:DNA invertase Pin-like site-specific DNA recombinase
VRTFMGARHRAHWGAWAPRRGLALSWALTIRTSRPVCAPLAARWGIRKTPSTPPFEKSTNTRVGYAVCCAPRNPSRGPLISSTKRAALYVRVSTDAQTLENQIRELRQVAGRRGWDVVEVYSDAGISGAKGRNGRPGLDSMLKDASRRKFDIIMAWSIDRLGRSLSDLLDTIQHLEACSVDLYLDQQGIDTSTPMGKLVFQLTGAFAEFERTMIRQRVKAGLKRAVAQGVKLGRPKIDSTTERKVRKQLAKGVGILKVAKSLGIGTGTVQRIASERAMSLRGAEQ